MELIQVADAGEGEGIERDEVLQAMTAIQKAYR